MYVYAWPCPSSFDLIDMPLHVDLPLQMMHPQAAVTLPQNLAEVESLDAASALLGSASDPSRSFSSSLTSLCARFMIDLM